MPEKSQLIWIHAALFLAQLVSVGLAVGVNSAFAALSPVVGTAQAFFPNPWK